MSNNCLKLVLVFFFMICLSGCGFVKVCNEGDKKKGNTCIEEHLSEPLSQLTCPSGMHLKEDGRCYNILDVKMGFPSTTHYCTTGYLRDDKCVVETTYDAYIDFFGIKSND